MSEPEAKQYVLESIENCRKSIAAISSGDLDAQKKVLEEVAQVLEGLQEKVFLKTKKAVAPTFQVKESSEAVAERAEDLSDDDAVRELKDMVGQLKDNVATLQAASKTQSVIVT